MYDPMTYADLPNAISSQVSGSGPLPYAGPDGTIAAQFGLALAHANLSARQAKAWGLLTSGIYGPPSITSSRSASLQSSLVSRLQAKTSMLGSTLYTLTWKLWVTPSGVSRFRLRASARRTFETATTGWPTPKVTDTNGPGNSANRQGGMALHTAAQMAGWATPQTRDHKGAPLVGVHDRGTKGPPLNEQARLAGWPTPCARDHFPAHTPDYIAAKKAQGHGMANLNDLVQLALNGPARLTATGVMLTGSHAQMESGGQLNPAHSRWLMGLPPEWDDCAPTETLSMLKRLASSSSAY